MTHGEATGTADYRNAPRPPTGALLQFLDFFYVVVFADFLQRFYSGSAFHGKDGCPNSYGHWIPSDIAHLRTFILAALAFYFIATDWIHARALTEREPYRSYRRFFVDLLIVFLSYGVLAQAVEGRIQTAAFMACVFLAGAIWGALCIWENPEGELRPVFWLIFWTHGFGFIVMAAFAWIAGALDGNHDGITRTAVGCLGLVLLMEFLFEEIVRVRRLPRWMWFGSPAVPFASRERLLKWSDQVVGAVRDLLRSKHD